MSRKDIPKESEEEREARLQSGARKRDLERERRQEHAGFTIPRMHAEDPQAELPDDPDWLPTLCGREAPNSHVIREGERRPGEYRKKVRSKASATADPTYTYAEKLRAIWCDEVTCPDCRYRIRRPDADPPLHYRYRGAGRPDLAACGLADVSCTSDPTFLPRQSSWRNPTSGRRRIQDLRQRGTRREARNNCGVTIGIPARWPFQAGAARLCPPPAVTRTRAAGGDHAE